MLGKVQSELAKMLARDIYTYAKKVGKDVTNELKETGLTKRGKGLPAAVLAEFNDAFVEVLGRDSVLSHGFAEWQYRGEKREFEFLLADLLIADIATRDWPEVASQTKEGDDQVTALGGRENYQVVVSSSVTSMFDVAIKASCGKFFGDPVQFGWMVLTPVICAAVAPRDSTEFSEERIFYRSSGKEKDVEKDYSLAKKLITGTFFRTPSQPSKGPYLV